MSKKQKVSIKGKLDLIEELKKDQQKELFKRKIKIKPKSYAVKFKTDQPKIREAEVKAVGVKYKRAGIKILSGHVKDGLKKIDAETDSKKKAKEVKAFTSLLEKTCSSIVKEYEAKMQKMADRIVKAEKDADKAKRPPTKSQKQSPRRNLNW